MRERRPARTGRQQDGRFAPGHSGNPAGRRPGSANHATLAAQALLEGQAERVTQVAVQKALEGDPTALRLVLERLLPRCRSGRVRLRLPVLDRVEDVPHAMRRVVAAAAAGAIDLGDAEALAGLLDRQREALATADLAQRVEDLEALVAPLGRR